MAIPGLLARGSICRMREYLPQITQISQIGILKFDSFFNFQIVFVVKNLADSEQIRMATCSTEYQFVTNYFVKQQPIRFNVTIPPA